jgi:tetratricopeptide (TPR) repeat protein
MTTVSKFARATALGLVLAASGIASTPAMAKEKPPAASPTPALSKAFRDAAGPVQVAIKAGAFADLAPKVAAVEAAAQSPYEKFVAGQFRLSLAVNNKDVPAQVKAKEAMVASGGTPPDLVGPLNFEVGFDNYSAGNYQRAIQLLTEAERVGFKNEQLPVLMADTNFKMGAVPAGLAIMEKAVAARKAAGQTSPEDWYKRTRAGAFNAKPRLDGEVTKWSRLMLMAYPTPLNWNDALVLYRDYPAKGAAITMDVFRLMRATKSLSGQAEYREYASLATEAGLPGEAKAVIDEGTALGKIPAGDRNMVELRAMALSKIPADRAGLPAAEKRGEASRRAALATAEAYFAYGEDAKAIALYRLALKQKSPTDADKTAIDADAANMHLGMALLRSGQVAEAKTALSAVTGTRAELAALWMLWADQMGKPAA